MAAVAPDTVVVSTRVEPEIREQLEALARLEDRSLAGQIRHHLRRSLAAQQFQQASPPTAG